MKLLIISWICIVRELYVKHELYFDRGIRQYFSPKDGGVGRRILFGELQGFQETEQESVVANGVYM